MKRVKQFCLEAVMFLLSLVVLFPVLYAVVSSFKNRAVDGSIIAMGEIGLSGEVRAVSMIKVRVQEAKKLGFTCCIVPGVCRESLKDIEGIKIIYVDSVSEAMDLI